jgi:hypothetical protein
MDRPRSRREAKTGLGGKAKTGQEAVMMASRRLPWAPLLLLWAPLSAQEFQFGIAAPEVIHQNSTFEVALTVTSTGIPSGMKGAEGWTLGVAHQGLTLVGVTTQGTIVEKLLAGGVAITEPTSASPQYPGNDGFVSAVILSENNVEATLPAAGTVTVARATYYAGRGACFEGARVSITNGLQGSGQPVVNGVTWGGHTFLPALAEKAYPGCEPSDYILRLSLPADPLPAPLGEERRFTARVNLEQTVASASGWTLAVAHDPARLRLLDVSIAGTGLDALLGPGGFVLFEITSGPGNSGFTAQADLSPETTRALPAPEQTLAVARYQSLPALDPSLVGTRIETTISFAPSLQGSGGPLWNSVSPQGRLRTEPGKLTVEVLPASRFVRGDANGDGEIDISDPLAILFFLFGGFDGIEEICAEAGNANNDNHLDITDAIFILERLFIAPQPFPAPYPDCGPDPSLPSLGCDVSSCR